MAPRSDLPPGSGGGLPELELDVRRSASPRAKPKSQPVAEVTLELAVDPRALVRERSDRPSDVLVPPGPSRQAPLAAVHDLAFDARLLADYGEPPRHWLLSPLYAWRVLRRRRDLKRALAGRREEAARAAIETEDALVAFAERARATAERTAAYTQALEELRNAEEALRSRDRVLAADQDAQNARLSQVDARLSMLEAELAHALSDERAIAAELSVAQGALAREEARLKRAEIELRAAQQRAGGGGEGE